LGPDQRERPSAFAGNTEEEKGALGPPR
jgi:hypothetical protein